MKMNISKNFVIDTSQKTGKFILQILKNKNKIKNKILLLYYYMNDYNDGSKTNASPNNFSTNDCYKNTNPNFNLDLVTNNGQGRD